MKVKTILHKIVGGEGKKTYPTICNLYWHFDVFISLKSQHAVTLIGLLFHITFVVSIFLGSIWSF